MILDILKNKMAAKKFFNGFISKNEQDHRKCVGVCVCVCVGCVCVFFFKMTAEVPAKMS